MFVNSIVTHASMVRGYLKHLRSVGYSENTVISYERNLSLFESYLNNKNIGCTRKITKDVITGYFAHVMESENTQLTKGIKIKSVKKLFRYLTETGHLLIDPTEDIPGLPKKKSRPGQVLTISEIKRLLMVPDVTNPAHLRNRTIIEILYSSAIRINELTNLMVYDVSLTDRTIAVNNGKGGRDRVVPMGRRAAAYAKEYAKTVRQAYLKGNPPVKTFFLNCHGTPLNAGTVRKFLRNYRIKADINKPVSPHTLRRTCATHLLSQGADIRYIQKLLGHKKLSTTEIYTRIEPKDVKEMHKKIKDK